MYFELSNGKTLYFTGIDRALEYAAEHNLRVVRELVE